MILTTLLSVVIIGVYFYYKHTQMKEGIQGMEKFFKLKENNTDVKTEVIAGLTTFMTMAYILAVNP